MNYKNEKRNLIIALIIINFQIFLNKELKEQRNLNQITKISIIVN